MGADRTSRADDLALVVEEHGTNHVVDDMVMSRVFRRLGWSMLTDDALAMLADAYEARAGARDRMNAENRRIWAARAAEAQA